MPSFRYTARDAAGQMVEATLDSHSRRDALRVLASRGLQPVRLEETRAAGAKRSVTANSSAIFAEPVVFTRALHLPFLQALHELTTSGLSAGEAVRLLSPLADRRRAGSRTSRLAAVRSVIEDSATTVSSPDRKETVEACSRRADHLRLGVEADQHRKTAEADPRNPPSHAW